MSYDLETQQRENAKEKEAWKIAITSVVAFIIIGSIVYFSGFGGKY